MIDNPHKVLGVNEGASQEEIKKAYRRLVKQYHPDLHPNDPNAAKKITEINEAYDMLINPEKYAAKRAQQQKQQQQRQQYGGNPYGNQQYGGSQYNRQYGGYGGSNTGGNRQQGYGGWYGDFDFDFEDIFGFGGQQRASTRPSPEPGDSMEIRKVIECINAGRSEEAIRILTYIPSTGRNARWYYLSALANHSLGNKVKALEQMQKAAQMEPQNQVYNQLLRQFRQSARTYEENGKGFDTSIFTAQKICFGLLAAQLCCGGFPCIIMRVP